MTKKVPLEATLRRASQMAENMFERDGEVTAFWLAETADWRGFPDKAVIQAIGQPLVMSFGTDLPDCERNDRRPLGPIASAELQEPEFPGPSSRSPKRYGSMTQG